MEKKGGDGGEGKRGRKRKAERAGSEEVYNATGPVMDEGPVSPPCT